MEENKENEELKYLYEEIQQLYKNRELQQVLEKADVLYIKAEELNNAYFMGNALCYKGVAYYNLNKISEAIIFIEKSKEVFEKSKLADELRSTKISLGALYSNVGEYKKALHILIEATEIQTNDQKEVSIIYNNIGLIYFTQNNNKKAIEYYKKAIEIEDSFQKTNKNQINKYLVNIASVYLKINRLDEAEEIYKSAIELCEKESDFDFLISSIKGLTKLWVNRNQLEKAEQILKRGLALSKQFNFHIHIVDFSLYLADLCKKRNKNNLRGRHLNIALDASKRSNRSKEQLVLEHLVDFYKDQKQLQKAFQTLKELDALQSIYFFKEEKEKLIELQESFDLQQKEKLIQRERDYAQELILKNEKLEQSLNRQKSVELQLKSLQLQLSPHFIFNSLQSIQSFIFKKEVEVASDYLAQFARLMRAILIASKKDAISLEEEESILRDYLDLERERFSSAFSYQILFENIKDKKAVRMPFMLLQIFIENAILHGVQGRENGKILILFRQQKRQLFVHVIDNGKGYQPNEAQEEKGSYKESLALKILKERKIWSSKSINLSYNFKIWNRKKGSGTHVAVQIIDKKKKLGINVK